MTQTNFDFFSRCRFPKHVPMSARWRVLAITLSATLHGLLFAAVLLGHLLNPSPVNRPIEVEIVTSSQNTAGSPWPGKSVHPGPSARHKQAKQSKGTSPNRLTAPPQINRLLPSSIPSSEAFLHQAQSQNSRSRADFPVLAGKGNAQGNGDNKDGSGNEDGDSYDVYGESGTYGVSEAMNLEKAAETIPFFHALWSKIDGLIDYPIEIAQMRIGGQVTVHMTIDRYGQIEGDFLRVKADHPILKTYTMVILAQALRSPLPMRLQLPAGTKSIPVVVTVDYRSVTLTSLETRRGHFFKNALDFERTRYVDPYLKEIIDYAMTNYVPPIIPIPGGLMIDFVRAYQMIDNYANDRPDLYEQRDRKYTLLKQKLELSVRRKEPRQEPM